MFDLIRWWLDSGFAAGWCDMEFLLFVVVSLSGYCGFVVGDLVGCCRSGFVVAFWDC